MGSLVPSRGHELRKLGERRGPGGRGRRARGGGSCCSSVDLPVCTLAPYAPAPTPARGTSTFDRWPRLKRPAFSPSSYSTTTPRGVFAHSRTSSGSPSDSLLIPHLSSTTYIYSTRPRPWSSSLSFSIGTRLHHLRHLRHGTHRNRLSALVVSPCVSPPLRVPQKRSALPPPVACVSCCPLPPTVPPSTHHFVPIAPQGSRRLTRAPRSSSGHGPSSPAHHSPRRR